MGISRVQIICDMFLFFQSSFCHCLASLAIHISAGLSAQSLTEVRPQSQDKVVSYFMPQGAFPRLNGSRRIAIVARM
jgi:hypothetical protein